MHALSRIVCLQGSAGLTITAFLMCSFWLMATSAFSAMEQGKTTAAAQDDDSGDWIFDDSLYANDPKTGKRVDQYKHEKTPYRDPNALFDSYLGSPFYNDSYGGYFYDYYPGFYGFWPELYSQYYLGVDGSGYYPYDGDPNDEED